MNCYILSGNSFSVRRVCNAAEYTLYPDTEKAGEITVADDGDMNYTGDFLYAGACLYLISGMTPDEGKTKLKLGDWLSAFDRDVFMPEGTFDTIGEFVSEIFDGEYIEQSDIKHKMSFLSVTDDSTAEFVAPVTDDADMFNLYDYLNDSRAEGVRYSADIRSGSLEVIISDSAARQRRVIPGDGRATLESASFTNKVTEKVTVREVDSSDPDEPVFTDTDYYLSESGAAVEEPPQVRRDGEWVRISCKTGDDTQEKAQEIFDKNEESHKIEFYSTEDYELHDPVLIKMSFGTYATQINQIKISSKDSRKLYVCGTLPTTLTDKLAEAQKKEDKK